MKNPFKIAAKNLRALLVAVTLACALSLSSGTAMAQTSPAPGCNMAMWGFQVNFADVNRLKDLALSTVMKTVDSVLAATCFDQAMALTSRLGALFSDSSPDQLVAAAVNYVTNKEKDNLYNKNAGLGLRRDGKPSTIAFDLQQVIGDPLNNYLDSSGNFVKSITQEMGATVTHALKDLTDGIMGALNDVSSGLNYLNNGAAKMDGALNNVMGVIEKIEYVICLLGATMSPLAALIYTVAGVIATVAAMLETVMNAIDFLQQGINGLKQGLADLLNPKSLLGGPLGSISGLPYVEIINIPAELYKDAKSGLTSLVKGCPLAQALWKGGIDGAGKMYAGIIGGGLSKGLPYFNYQDLVNVRVTRTIPGAPPESSGNLVGTLLQTDANNAKYGVQGQQNNNSDLLAKAQGDLDKLNPINALGGPGNLPFWNKPKNPLPRDAASCQILADMQGQTIPAACCKTDPSKAASKTCP
jgi:hypothetical protein